MNDRTEKGISGFVAAVGGAIGLALYLAFAPPLPPDRKHLENSLATTSAGLGAGSFGLASLLLPTAASRRRRRVEELEGKARDLAEQCDKQLESLRLLEQSVSAPAGSSTSPYGGVPLPDYDYRLRDVIGSYTNKDEDALLYIREQEADRAIRNARKMLHAIDARLALLRPILDQKGFAPIDDVLAPPDADERRSRAAKKMTIK